MSNARPFTAATSKLAYAQAFAGSNARRQPTGLGTVLRRLALRRRAPHA